MNRDGVPHLPTLDDAGKENVQKLNSLSGPAFDKEFLTVMIDTHQKALELHRQQATNAKNEDVRNYAEDATPVIEKHLNRARELQGELQGTPRN
jgi:putative membrane protein